MLVTLTEHHVLTPFGRDLHCRTCSALQRTPGWLVILTFFLKIKQIYICIHGWGSFIYYYLYIAYPSVENMMLYNVLWLVKVSSKWETNMTFLQQYFKRLWLYAGNLFFEQTITSARKQWGSSFLLKDTFGALWFGSNSQLTNHELDVLYIDPAP